VACVFIGKDAELVAARFERLKEPCCTGQGEDVVEDDFIKMLAEERLGCGDIGLAAELAQRDRHGTADCGAHRRVVAFRQTELALSEGHALMNRGKVVDQSAVQVEEDVLHDKMCFIRIANRYSLDGLCMARLHSMASVGVRAFLNMSDTTQKADWGTRRKGGTFVVHFSGAWVNSSPKPSVETLHFDIESEAELTTLHLEADHLTNWDSTLLVAVRQLCVWTEARGIHPCLDGMPEGVQNLIELSRAVPENKQSDEESPDDFLSNMGERSLAAYRGLNGYFDFLGLLCIDLFAFLRGRGRVRAKDFLLLLQATGPQAVPIVSLLSFLTGLIIAFIGVIQLQKFAADIYVADLVGLAVTRELGAVMTGVIMAGRTGAAFAAQIGSMQVNEEVDALTTFGISPMQFLVVPRVWALVLMMPLLCGCANFVAILGGMVVAVAISDVTVLQYCHQVQAAVGLNDLAVGIFKSGIFGLIIALAGCYRGLNCGRDASSVGLAATSAVVTSITWIVIADAIFAVMFQILGI